MPPSAKILLIDDERAITDDLGPFLERAGFTVQIAADGAAGLAAQRIFKPDLVVLDVMMPHLNGRELLRQWRAQEIWTPVIMLTQVGSAGERTMALGEGADDYINKPFDPNELTARINAILRRIAQGAKPLAAAQKIRSGPLTLDRAARCATLDGKDLLLTPKAFALLEYLMLHAAELITRERLLDAVWGWDHPAGTRTVDTRIAEIRKALSDDPDAPRYVETMPAQGYRFVGPVEKASA
jgi:DNA-binding response OmpR family regulator